MDKWDRVLSPDNVLVGIKANRKFDAIRELAQVLADDPAIGNHKAFIVSLIRREKEGSTAIGKGVAVPHTHEDSIRRQRLAIGISRQGIDFGSVDGEPVRIIALLATPKKHQKQHMELLASLSRLLQQDALRQALIEVEDGEAVCQLFRQGV